MADRSQNPRFSLIEAGVFYVQENNYRLNDFVLYKLIETKAP